ncbi:hypothetical protein Fmac_000304 [Flemingia macrophylla]|uniref:Omega-hydroxypalmitate O-feruloyl transferase n=1 Tax=Flemingia macrophylla TaxID=520843 RepID=A0ABD1NDX4_9FABA
MLQSMDVPDCIYRGKPVTITPSAPTPKHSLYLSNLDDQKFLRFSIKYLYLFSKSISLDVLKSSLGRVLVDYYPLAGRLRTVDDHKLEVDCNGEGAIFAEAFMDTTLHQLLEPSKTPNKSWKKFLYKVEAHTFTDVPPLVIQVTGLGCGGMILCTAISHCICDGIGTSQFLEAWGSVSRNAEMTKMPFHWREGLKGREPPEVKFRHPWYRAESEVKKLVSLLQSESESLVATSLTLTPSHILSLKNNNNINNSTSFEVLAAHTWRSWISSLSLPPTLTVNLLFSVNVRPVLNLPEGYYGNAFILACAQSTVHDLLGCDLRHAVQLVQEAKARARKQDYVRSFLDFLHHDKTLVTDLSTSFVISQWSNLGLEDLDFGQGKPLHMGPLTSDVYCLFLPVIGHPHAIRLLLSLPPTMLQSFHYHMNLTTTN